MNAKAMYTWSGRWELSLGFCERTGTRGWIILRSPSPKHRYHQGTNEPKVSGLRQTHPTELQDDDENSKKATLSLKLIFMVNPALMTVLVQSKKEC